MARLREWVSRLWGTLRRNPNHDQLEEELRAHLELAADDLRRRGGSPEESSRAARVHAGGVVQAMEAMRDQRGLPWLENLVRDVRHGLRVLRRSPGFTAVALITIALGIGANTAIFSLINAVLLRPLPFADPERLVVVWEDLTFAGFSHNTPAAANYADIKAQSRTLEDVAALDFRSFNLTGDGEPERVEANGVTANLLPLLGTRPALGRSFTAEEDSPEGPKVVMLSYGLWQSRYGGERNIIGRDLLLNNEKYTVVGVLPAGFEFLRTDIGIFVPIAFTRDLLNNRGRHYLTLVARMKPGVSVAESQTDTQAIMRRIGQEFPQETFNGRLGAVVLPLREQLAGEVRRPLAVLLVAVGFVLLIACANVANLLLARATKRRTEAAVRTALGAGYARTIAQALTESMLLAVGGSGIGLIFARWSFAFLKRMVPEGMVASTNLELDWRILGFTLLVALGTGLIFGLAPALQIARVNLNEVLKQSGGRADLRSGSHFRSALVIAEVALAMLLLVGAGLLIQTFFNLRGQYRGLRPQHVLTVRTQLPETRYRDLPQRVTFYDQVLEHVKSLPGVVSAGYTTTVPLVWKGGTTSFIPEGRQPEPGVVYDANYRQISEEYFESIGIELKQGRRFVKTDDAQSIRVAIINSEQRDCSARIGNAVAGYVRRAGIAAFNVRYLWRAFIFRGAAHPRYRAASRIGGTRHKHPWIDFEERNAAGRSRSRHRNDGLVRSHKADAEFAVRSERQRSDDIRGRSGPAARHRLRGMLRPGPTRDEGRSYCRASIRMTATFNVVAGFSPRSSKLKQTRAKARDYSYRSAMTGLRRVACHAGHRHAMIAITMRNNVIDTNVSGSADPVWNN